MELLNILIEAVGPTTGQGLAGQLAVVSVTINRVNDKRFPNTICGVVYEGPHRPSWKDETVMIPVRHRCQFSWFCDGKSDEPLDTDTFYESYVIAQDVLMGKYPDITEGATHYHSIMVEPYWAETLNETVQIQHHIFYK